MEKLYPKSKVEIKGFAARHYDTLLDMITFGGYSSFIRKVIYLMEIKSTDRIIDLGSGTGRNACLMMKYISTDGKLIGLDISEEMGKQFEKRCIEFPNAKFVHRRIDVPLPYVEEFDKAFISFVLHGFPQDVREVIIENAFRSLKKNGKFFILDYNEFSVKDMPLYLKIPFKLFECHYAFDFIRRDWKKVLIEKGFEHFEERLFFKEYVRLIRVTKI